MRLQVLVAAVNGEVNKLAEKMNLETEAIIINQCDHFAYQEYEHRGRQIRCFSMAERGVGLSRNTALQRSEGEISLFSDEDIVLYSGYEKTVLEAFDQTPDADIITFNFKVDPHRATYYNRSAGRIRWYNYGRYPAYAVAARTGVLHQANVSFSLLFGGGARYSNGEDSLFLHDCLKKGMHLYAATEEIGEEIYRESTWFKGYNEKFFFDRGVLYHQLYGWGAGIFSLRFLLMRGRSGKGEMFERVLLREAYKLMRQGIQEGKNRSRV